MPAFCRQETVRSLNEKKRIFFTEHGTYYELDGL